MVASAAIAQSGATVSGRVTSSTGAPIAGASVFISGMNIGTQTGDDGRYTFTVGAARVTGQPATLTARVIGYTAQNTLITLTSGATITHDFVLAVNPLKLGEVVVTGAGTSTTRERLATTINTVDSSVITRSANPQNMVSALAGAAPNVEIRTQSGDPGSSASIKIRGASSLSGTNQPLFVVDGQPIDNSTEATSPDGVANAALSSTVTQNRAADINPNDIESIEILKGSAASAIYGARASNGVVMITTKRGRSGPTKYSVTSTNTFDNVQTNIPLQRTYGQGSHGAPPTPGCGVASASCTSLSWGPLLPAGTKTYDHEGEIFDTGLTSDNNLSLSGGNDRTTFYVSGGLTSQNGVVVGPNNKYNRASIRLKGTQQVSSELNIGGNISYIDSRGRYIEKGSTTSGLLLGALRTPPDYNNVPYLDPVSGVPVSYRFPHATTAAARDSRGYDNPFFTLNNPANRSELGRSISNVNADWNPLSWLEVKYTLGGDYYSDWRLQATPLTGSTEPDGQVIRNDFNNLEIDHNLLVTAKKSFSDNLDGTFTVGQNLNSRRVREVYILGLTLNAPQPYSLNNTIGFTPFENRSLAHVEAYFGQAEFDAYNQFYLTLGLRNDGFSTFGASNRRANYPKASLAWNFTNALGITDQKGMLSYGKLRLAYGETGKEPPIYAAVDALGAGATFSSGFGDALNVNQSGQGGLTTDLQKGNPSLKPERQKESEVGLDLGFFDQKADLGMTYYSKKSTDVIIAVPQNAASTGSQTAFLNGAAVTNKGFEAALNVRPYTTKDLSWDFGIQFAKNKGRVLNLLGAEFVPYNVEGFNGSIGSSTVGYAPGVIRGSDFVRCGRGLTLEDGRDVDALCGNAPKGALFIDSDGLPVDDPTDRVIADPNPKWTMSYTTSISFATSFRLSALVDMRHGGQVWDGTRGALYRFGTHAATLVRAGTGTFGKDFYTDIYPIVAGPGAGQVAFSSISDWQSWFTSQGGSAGTTQQQFVESGSFAKLRELSLTYTVPPQLVKNFVGFSSADIRIAGRNLHTWTNYKGLDPESNLAGAESLTQGIDFFNNPQTRSFVLSVSLNR